jgi:uncharacterized protein
MRRPPKSQLLVAIGSVTIFVAFAVLVRWTPPHFDATHLGLPDPSGQHPPFAEHRQDPTLPPFPVEVWAGGYRPFTNADLIEQTQQLLSNDERSRLAQLCGRCLYHTLTNVVAGHNLGYWTFVATGDIPEMWIRDSAVQLGVYLPRIPAHPPLRRLIEGALRTQAFFITQDPYANAFNAEWRRPDDLTKFERLLGRGGWVGTRNYELDSGAYFINLLYNYWASEGVSRRAGEALLAEPLIQDAVEVMIDTWITEQHHEDHSRYRYSELPRDGIGAKTGYTGMTWSGFRPSDDPNVFGYSIPSNMYAAGALQRALALNDAAWQDGRLHTKATKLLRDIEQGILRFGIVEVEPGVEVYAYEVDGLGRNLTDFDDANVPSLLSMPLLGWKGYDQKVYENTRKRLLDPEYNDFYFASDELRGIGSPHTDVGSVWPLSLMVQALTSNDAKERVEMLRMLLKSQCHNGLMHESVSVDDLQWCSRPIFEWANALLVAVAEATIDVDCEKHAEEYRLKQITWREKKDAHGGQPQNGGKDDALYYESLESLVAFDTPTRGAASSFHHYGDRLSMPAAVVLDDAEENTEMDDDATLRDVQPPPVLQEKGREEQ